MDCSAHALAAASAAAALGGLLVLTGCGPSGNAADHLSASGSATHYQPGLTRTADPYRIGVGQTKYVQGYEADSYGNPDGVTYGPGKVKLDAVTSKNTIAYTAEETGSEATATSPPPGHRFVLVTWSVTNPNTVTYDGEQATIAVDSTFVPDQDHHQYGDLEGTAAVPDPYTDISEAGFDRIAPGATVTGTDTYVIPDGPGTLHIFNGMTDEEDLQIHIK